MTRQETAKLIALLETAYPYFGKGMTAAGTGMLEDLWYTALVSLPYPLAQKAFMRLVKACKFTPTVADLLEAAERICLEEKDYVAKVRGRVPHIKRGG